MLKNKKTYLLSLVLSLVLSGVVGSMSGNVFAEKNPPVAAVDTVPLRRQLLTPMLPLPRPRLRLTWEALPKNLDGA